jgi:hypothetical protein
MSSTLIQPAHTDNDDKESEDGIVTGVSVLRCRFRE